MVAGMEVIWLFAKYKVSKFTKFPMVVGMEVITLKLKSNFVKPVSCPI